MELKINATYSYSTIAPGVLGASFSNMKLIGILSPTEALKIQDIRTIHSQILSTANNKALPESVLDCTFLKFSSPDGSESLIALEYLINLTPVECKKLKITIDNYTQTDWVIISDTLRSLGYENITYELV